jgi:hypothetical protein
MSLAQESINLRLFVGSLNDVGPEYYDPHPLMQTFCRKEKRYRETDISVYKDRDFTANIFRETGAS